MKGPSKLPIYLLYASTAVLALFAIFLFVNFVWSGQLPSRMEMIAGRSTDEIRAYDERVLGLFLAGFRMVTLLLGTYCVAAVMLIRVYGQGHAWAGRVVYVKLAIFLPLATVIAVTASTQTPWPVFVVSGALALAAYILDRKGASTAER